MHAKPENERHFLNKVRTGNLLIREDGTVMNTVTLKVYDKPSVKGHISVAAKVNGRTIHILAGRLVYLAKVGPLNPKDHVVHIDGDKANNHPSNLMKMDDSDTALHAYALGNGQSGARVADSLLRYNRARLHFNAKLTPEQAVEIRRRALAGATRASLAREFSVDRKTVIGIIRGTRYKAADAMLRADGQPTSPSPSPAKDA